MAPLFIFNYRGISTSACLSRYDVISARLRQYAGIPQSIWDYNTWVFSPKGEETKVLLAGADERVMQLLLTHTEAVHC